MQKRLTGSPAGVCLAPAATGPAKATIDHKTMAQTYKHLWHSPGEVDA